MSQTEAIVLPETAFELSAHLSLADHEAAKWAWYEMAGAVLSHYVVDQQQRLARLLQWFYQDLAFCARENYYSMEAADLGCCVISKQGNSTTLATVLCLLAKQLDLKLDIILLPGSAVIVHHLTGNPQYINPLNGELLSKHQMHAFIRGELGNAAPFKQSYLKPVKPKRLIIRLLHELKAGAVVSQKFEVALECCNLLLQWNEDDVHVKRERAFIAQQLGCINIAVADLEFFIEHNPHDPMIELLKLQLKELNSHHQTTH